MSTQLEDHVAFGAGSAGRGPKPELRKSSTVRAVAWSPAGADAAGGCLLAVVTQDHKVRCRLVIDCKMIDCKMTIDYSRSRTVAWSLAGADAAGGCLLAVVTQDHKVDCFASFACSPVGKLFRWRALAKVAACRGRCWCRRLPAVPIQGHNITGAAVSQLEAALCGCRSEHG